MDTRCLFLTPNKEDIVCKASITKMRPSVFELNIYCTTEEHYRCPILVARTLREGHNREM